MIQSSPISSVNAIVKEFIGPTISPMIHLAFRSLKTYHEIWWIYQKQKVYRNPNNWIYLGSGYILNNTLGKLDIIKRSFQIYTIALRIYYVVQEIRLLQEAWIDLGKTLTNKYPTRNYVSWDEDKSQTKFSQSYIGLIVYCTAQIFVRLATLSARCIEVYDAFYMENNHEIVIDIVAGIHELSQHGSMQRSVLRIAEKITPLLTDKVRPQQIFDAVENLSNKSETIKKIIKQSKRNTTILIETLFDGCYYHLSNLFNSLNLPESNGSVLLLDYPTNSTK